MTNSIKIGFIGLGKMGSGICANIVKSGYDVTVYNRTAEKSHALAAKGVNVADSVKNLVENSDIIFTSLMDDNSILTVCDGEGGILSALTANKIHVGLTTINPTTADLLKSMHEHRGCHYIAAPVIGRPDAAAAGKLITFLAGDTGAIKTIAPIVETYTIKKVELGEVAGSANALKICVNYMAMTQLAMLGEIFAYAEKSNLDKSQVLAVSQLFFAGNESMKEYAIKIAERDFDQVGFDLTAGLKDALIFESAFNAAGVKPSAILGAKEYLVSAKANGLGNKDWSALTDIPKVLSGLKP